jgi:hypothetical protein
MVCTRRGSLKQAAVIASGLIAGRASAAISPPSIRDTVRDAYVYGYPMVDNYRIQYAYFYSRSDPEFKAPRNTLFNIPRVFTPEDRAIQTPNSDTPYSWIGLDLRAEPIVFTVPPIEQRRYWSLQLIDLYTFNFAYLGSRTTGNGGGSFAIAGPGWRGATPAGITAVIRCETLLASAQFRTQLFNPADLDAVKAIQSQYVVRPLSAFQNSAPPPAAPAIHYLRPLSPEAQRRSPDFFRVMNFALQFAPAPASEAALRARFAAIGIGPGLPFNAASLKPAMRRAFQAGIADAWAEFEQVKTALNEGRVSSGDLFGTRVELRNNYLYRMAGAVLGIYGNSKEEAIYPAYYLDAERRPLTGAHRYTLRFAPGEEPPVNSFWSITLYEQPSSLLSANPIDRYLLNSTMLPGFVRDADGGLTFNIQHESPGAAREANWLPAPAGPFSVIMRLYWPKPEALDGPWRAPPMQRAA